MKSEGYGSNLRGGISYKRPILVGVILVGPQELLLVTVKRWKLSEFGHGGQHDTLPKTVVRRNVEGGRCQGSQKKRWLTNISELSACTALKVLKRELNTQEYVTYHRRREK